MKFYFYNSVLDVVHKTIAEHNAARTSHGDSGPYMWWHVANGGKPSMDGDFSQVSFDISNGHVDSNWSYYIHHASNGDKMAIGYKKKAPLGAGQIMDIINRKGWLNSIEGNPCAATSTTPSTLPTPRRLSLV